VQRHLETSVPFDQLGLQALPYLPTFEFAGEYIDAEHERIAKLPLRNGLVIQLPHPQTGSPVPGWLQPADALKLYEMAHFCASDILEIGSFHGLSAIIMSLALRASTSSARIHTVDLDASYTAAALSNVRAHELERYVSASTEEGAAAVGRLAALGRKYGFAFVDHSHEYAPVLEVCRGLHQVLKPGGFVLFHDYNDPQNRTGEYGVYRGIEDGLPKDHFDFYGVYGCAALHRMRVDAPIRHGRRVGSSASHDG
jgi:SAM-dependent methyltransferase